jgi:hypothetical protein
MEIVVYQVFVTSTKCHEGRKVMNTIISGTCLMKVDASWRTVKRLEHSSTFISSLLQPSKSNPQKQSPSSTGQDLRSAIEQTTPEEKAQATFWEAATKSGS